MPDRARGAGRHCAALALAVGIARAAHASTGLESGLPLGGVLEPRPGMLERWSWSGAWRFPVGDPRDLESPDPAGGPAYHVTRNVGVPEEGRPHQGADISCGHGGGLVRAAAGGIVLVADRSGWNSGYGRRVVLGHRLPDGTLIYTVYAHLAPGSVRVHAGQRIGAGTPLGRVGQSGRATTPHLHFEVRLDERPEERWEKAKVTDPIAFVRSHLPAAVTPDSLGRCMEWAQCAAVIQGDPPPGQPLQRDLWWRMLAAATCHPLLALPAATEALRDSLISVGVLPEDDSAAPDTAVSWRELARDLARVRRLGVRLPARPLPTPAHHALCRRMLRVPDPGHHPASLTRPGAAPTLAAGLLSLLDLAPELKVPRARHPHRPGAASAGRAARRPAKGVPTDSASAGP